MCRARAYGGLALSVRSRRADKFALSRPTYPRLTQSLYPSRRKAAEDVAPPARCSMRVCTLSVCAAGLLTIFVMCAGRQIRDRLRPRQGATAPLPFVMSSLRHIVMTFFFKNLLFLLIYLHISKFLRTFAPAKVFVVACRRKTARTY